MSEEKGSAGSNIDVKQMIKGILNPEPVQPKQDVAAMLKAAKRQKELTDEQKAAILAEVNKTGSKFPKINDLAKALFPDDPNADGRSWHGILIKNYLANLNIKTVGAHVYVPDKEVELTDAHKEYIANNISPTCGVLQLAKDIFENPNLTNLHAEVRAVIKFAETLPPQIVDANKQEFENIPTGLYKPARTINSIIWKINSYFKDASGALDKDKLTNRQLKGLEALIGYINTYRFIHQINSFDTEPDLKLFESTFMRHTYDKPDLTQEEVDQYIMVATETVNVDKSWKRKEQLEKLQDDTYQSSEDGKFEATMRLVEAIGKAEASYNNGQKRLNDLLDSLKVKRSKRLEQKVQENGNFNQIFEFWKAEETRKQMVEAAKKMKQNIADEYQKLNEMDEIRCRIFGLSKDEVDNS